MDSRLKMKFPTLDGVRVIGGPSIPHITRIFAGPAMGMLLSSEKTSTNENHPATP